MSVSYQEHNFSPRPLAAAPGTAALITEWRNTGSILLHFYLFCASYVCTFYKGEQSGAIATVLQTESQSSSQRFTLFPVLEKSHTHLTVQRLTETLNVCSELWLLCASK